MKKLLVVAVWAIMVVILSGCTSFGNDTITMETANTTEEVTTETLTTEAITSEFITTTTTTGITTKKATTTEITTKEATTTGNTTKKAIKELRAKREGLSKKLQTLYDESLKKIFRYEEFSIDTSSATGKYHYDEMYEVLDALRGDYPQFWLYLTSYEEKSEYDKDGNPIYINEMRITYEYNWIIREDFSPKKMEKILSQIDQVCDEIISKMPNGTLKEKYLFLAKEIAYRTTYVSDRNFETTAEVDWSYCYMNGPLLEGESLCQGYAMAYQYLCNRAGLVCQCISGNAYGEAHCWNIVQTEKGSYHVDVTWCDQEDYFDDRYFMLTQEEIEIDHTPDSSEPIATGK